MALSLQLLQGRFSVHRLAADSALPEGLLAQPFFALLRSADELSICCAANFPVDSQRAEHGWAALAVDGPLEFELTGVLAGLSGALAAAGVSVFAIASFDTDYLLIREPQLETALTALGRAGYRIRRNPAGG